MIVSAERFRALVLVAAFSGCAGSAGLPIGAAAQQPPSAAPDATLPPEDPAMTKLAGSLMAQAQQGVIEPALFDPLLRASLTPEVIARTKADFAGFGAPKSIVYVGSDEAPDFHTYRYRVIWDTGGADEFFALNGKGLIVAWWFKPSPHARPTPAMGSN